MKKLWRRLKRDVTHLVPEPFVAVGSHLPCWYLSLLNAFFLYQLYDIVVTDFFVFSTVVMFGRDSLRLFHASNTIFVNQCSIVLHSEFRRHGP